MKTWYVSKGSEVVTIYDRLDTAGNGNVRFRGTIDAALTHFAFAMQECDELRDKVRESTEEIERLKRKAGEA